MRTTIQVGKLLLPIIWPTIRSWIVGRLSIGFQIRERHLIETLNTFALFAWLWVFPKIGPRDQTGGLGNLRTKYNWLAQDETGSRCRLYLVTETWKSDQPSNWKICRRRRGERKLTVAWRQRVGKIERQNGWQCRRFFREHPAGEMLNTKIQNRGNPFDYLVNFRHRKPKHPGEQWKELKKKKATRPTRQSRARPHFFSTQRFLTVNQWSNLSNFPMQTRDKTFRFKKKIHFQETRIIKKSISLQQQQQPEYPTEKKGTRKMKTIFSTLNLRFVSHTRRKNTKK